MNNIHKETNNSELVERTHNIFFYKVLKYPIFLCIFTQQNGA